MPTSGNDFKFGIFSIVFPFCFICYTLYYVRQPFIEENSEFKSIQTSVFESMNYWMVIFLSDSVCHSIICCGFTFVIWYRDVFENSDQLLQFHLLITLTGYVYILQSNIFARTLKTLSSICSVSFYGAFFGGKLDIGKSLTNTFCKCWAVGTVDNR